MKIKVWLSKSLKSFKKFFFTRKFIHLGLFLICFMFSLRELKRNLGEYQDDQNYYITPTFQSPDKIDLPSISICLTNFVDFEKLQEFYPENFNFSDFRDLKVEDRMGELASKLTISEIFETTLNFDQIFEDCGLLHPDTGKYLNCTSLNYTKIWLSLEAKCYQFFHNLTYLYSPSRIKGQFWVYFKLKNEIRDGTRIGFLLTTQNTSLEPFISNPSYFLISTTVLYTVMLTYTKEVIRKLEAPFNTKCTNYTHPYIDQLNCSRSCVVRKLSKNNDSSWPSILPTDDLRSEKFFFKVKDFHVHFKECLRTDCFQEDCLSSRYLIYTKYEKFKYSKEDKFTIRLIYNFAPETFIRYQPRISSEFSSVLSFISAPISFWLGLAFFNLFNFIVNFLEFIYQIFKKYYGRDVNQQ